ncbi:bifunctional glutamate N-acetyltransferase/amino-acid acetyltransferase ArgJ [Salinispirillum sp. LH 10-3-1]|uniref:Arginine biosynthesis bifunctional protein ArgJ n=1 Tax=Salinispirillum sp. LH 10-3-1 TaxID=2952525 RepID=A0AB38YHX3_9GAMM
MAVGAGITTQLLPVAGVELSVTSAGIKKPGKQDLTLMVLQDGSAAAGVFTQNLFCAAPVTLAKTHLAGGYVRALVINTGNANAGTGERGKADAERTCAAVAESLGFSASDVLPFSTGVIGEYLPMDRLLKAVPSLAEGVGTADWHTVAHAIMTTDTRAKGHSIQLELDGRVVTLTGVSKGAGMIKPNMATMLGFAATDAAVAPEDLQALLTSAANRSFNRITVDGDTSTNDACILVATGASGVALGPNSPHWSAFSQAVHELMRELAHQIVRDGEGATKFVAIQVHSAKSSADALEVAYTVAHSPLVKTAMSASDANWGRILAAVGRAPVAPFDLQGIDIYLDDVLLVKHGEKATGYEEAQGAAVFAKDTFTIHIHMGCGTATETVWTTDLSHEYVSINADYRS